MFPDRTTDMEKSDIGMIGLGVMGAALASNMENKGYRVSVYDRIVPGETPAVDTFMHGRGKGRNFAGFRRMEDFVASLERPRRIMMMIRAGAPVDETIARLLPLLDRGDVLIDGGNSDFRDTERRVREAEAAGIGYIGTGISGGEQGALHGPSIMPGGSETAWPLVEELLRTVAAKADDGAPCCAWMGPGGAGHFVKTVHNGIEYGDMQLIAETYALLKHRLGLSNEAMADVFDAWNERELEGFLLGITARILRFRDPRGGFLLDHVLDAAQQKGTGKWSVGAALEQDDPLPTISEAVFARMLSAMIDERRTASALYDNSAHSPHTATLRIDWIEEALYAARLIAYAQGFSLLGRASARHGWRTDCASVARIWRNGCIIRSAFLEKIAEAYGRDAGLKNLLFDGFFRDKIAETLPSLRRVVADGALSGVALPCMGSALSYFDGLRTLRSPANLLQAQRDCFGAHGYERTDEPRGAFFHTDWTDPEDRTDLQPRNAYRHEKS